MVEPLQSMKRNRKSLVGVVGALLEAVEVVIAVVVSGVGSSLKIRENNFPSAK